FYVAAVPGLILAVLSLFIADPARGASEQHAVGASRRPGSALLLVLRIPTMWWIIVSGVLHNFNMYTIGSFIYADMQRYHRVSTGAAGQSYAVLFGVGGIGRVVGGGAWGLVMRCLS